MHQIRPLRLPCPVLLVYSFYKVCAVAYAAAIRWRIMQIRRAAYFGVSGIYEGWERSGTDLETEKKDKYERERRRGYKTALSHLMLILWYDVNNDYEK